MFAWLCLRVYALRYWLYHNTSDTEQLRSWLARVEARLAIWSRRKAGELFPPF